LNNVWQGYSKGKVYKTSQLAEFINNAFETQEVEVVEKNKIYYFNIPASFDIETSSFTFNNSFTGEVDKAACMYIWQLGINGSIIYGRTWEEWITILEQLVDYLNLSPRRRLVIYVHNLGYEFQFIRKMFEWERVFAIKQRRPVYAICSGLEFRCSLFLSNYALAYIGENLLHKYPVKKLVGDLDYYKARHSKTPLTTKELEYCFNDVRVVMSYIQEKIELDGDITQIPLTNTGYVRNYCRKECFYEGVPEEDEAGRKRIQMNYRAIMKSLQVQSQDEYDQMHRAFMGGFTHASALYSGKVMYDVGSADLTSSYPFSMVCQYFPMTKGEYIGAVEDNKLLNHYLTNYCCLFDAEFTNLMPLQEFENPISESRCNIEGNYCVNNGRLVSADKCTTTLTELDYDTALKFYKWDSVKIMNMRIYHRGYLPKSLILAVLSLYGDKTELKDIEGKEIEYLVSKNMINAAFGMMVTAIVRDEFEYTEEWFKKGADVDSQLAGYNKNFNRFLYYGWGVWVTAHARHNLFSAINEFGNDYVYSDTDSIKGINFENHSDYFKKYNDVVFEKLLDMCNHYKIPFAKCKPRTKKGEEKLIGVWSMEKPYAKFKTVGAKRYIYEYYDGTMNMTVSGLNKKNAMPYLLEDNNNNHDLIFEKFGEGMFIPATYENKKGELTYPTGKLTLTYIEDEIKGTLVDYQGVTGEFHELSAIHMEPQSYYMSLVGDYIKFLKGVQYVEI
jgi:hypothetical protein